MATGGEHLKKVALELGGNAPLVVLDDADLDAGVQQAVIGAFLHSGQICMSVNRIIVQAPVYDEFVSRFATAASGIPFGDPTQEGTLVGPVVNDSQLEGLKDKIAGARKAGARTLIGGDIEGRVVPPHVFADVTSDTEIAREEIFGPMVGILRAGDEDHALELANDHVFGLSSSVFTQNLDRVLQFAQRIKSGMTFINEMTVQDEAVVLCATIRNPLVTSQQKKGSGKSGVLSLHKELLDLGHRSWQLLEPADRSPAMDAPPDPGRQPQLPPVNRLKRS